MALSYPVRTIIVWASILMIVFIVVSRARVEMANRVDSLPMTREKFDSLQAKLPEEFRSSAKTVGASYQLFNDAHIRFLYYDADSSDSGNPLPECIKIILDQKLALFFYPDSARDGFWKYDGFESGDYENPYEGELRFEEVN